MIRARLIGDAELGTEERGSEFADELFERSGKAIFGRLRKPAPRGRPVMVRECANTVTN